MKVLASISFACAALLATGAALADTPPPGGYTALYTFGDSLVDAGNLYAATGGAIPPASLGYQNGHFTNGYDFTDYLSVAITGHASVPSTLGGNDYAYGDARIVTNGSENVGGGVMLNVPDLQAQIDSYKAGHGTADPNALYTLTFGGNDLFAIARGEFTDLNAEISAIVQGYVGGVQQLEALGAQHILVTGLPARDANSAQIEAAFEAALAQLNNGDATVTSFSLENFFTAAATDPASVGLPALSFTGNCRDAHAYPACDGYFYFDGNEFGGVHPTAQVQHAVYEQIAPLLGLGDVPEPATWAELLAGFGLLGGAMRSSRRRALA